MRHLLIQPMNNASNSSKVMIIIWSSMALVLTSCFSGGILNSIIIPEHSNINSFGELIDSGLKVYINNNSWIWWNFKALDMKWLNKLDDKLSKIQNRIDYLGDFNIKVLLCKLMFRLLIMYLKQDFKEIAKGKAIFISELDTVTGVKFRFSELSLEVGQGRYYYRLVGWPIKKKSDTRLVLLKM